MHLMNIFYTVLGIFVTSSLATTAHYHRRGVAHRRSVRADDGNKIQAANLAQAHVPLADEPTRMAGSKGVGLAVDRDPITVEVPTVTSRNVKLLARWLEQDKDRDAKQTHSSPQLQPDARALIISEMIGAL